MSFIKSIFNLQLVAEGAPAGGEGTGEGTVVAAQEPEIKYGKQVTEGTEEEEVEEPEKSEEPKGHKPTFDELIKGEYKEDFSNKMQEIVQRRIRNSKDVEEKFTTLAPALSVLAEKYGVEDATDISALTDAIVNDDALYEAEAVERGVDIPTLKHIKSIESQNKVLAETMQQREKDMQNAEAWQNILAQAEEVKETYPEFDIDSEMANENFGHLIAVGIPVKDAYEVVHLNEIQARAGSIIAQKTANKVANSVKANKKRTVEGTTTGQAVQVKQDPESWTEEERDNIYQRVMNGEKIYL